MKKSRPIEKKTFARIGIALFVATVVWELLGWISLLPRQQFPLVRFFWSDTYSSLFHVFVYLSFIAILYLFLNDLPKMPKMQKGKMSFGQVLGYFSASRGVAMVLAIVGMILYLLLAILIKGPGGIMDYIRESNPLLTTGAAFNWQNLLIICVAAPVFEEIAFRKILLDPLRPFGDTVAILYSGIAFGLMHRNVQQILYAAALGLILGYVMVRTNNIFYCMLLHFLMNASSAVMLPFIDKMMDSMQVLIVVGLYAGLLILISVVGLILFFVHLKKVRLYPPYYRFSIPIRGGTVLSLGAILYVVLCVAAAIYAIF